MRLYRIFFLLLISLALISCSSADTPPTPIETLKTYVQAIKKKDVVKMKALLSQGSIKMAQDEAKAQNVTLDEVILRETLFPPDQKTLKFRNEKIDGDSATIEIERAPERFELIPFVKENGVWKIAKDKFIDDFQRQIEEEQRKAFEKETPEPVQPIDNSNQTTPTPLPNDPNS